MFGANVILQIEFDVAGIGEHTHFVYIPPSGDPEILTGYPNPNDPSKLFVESGDWVGSRHDPINQDSTQRIAFVDQHVSDPAAAWTIMKQTAADINAANLNYNVLGQNSNSAATTMAANAGIPVQDLEGGGISPGLGNNLTPEMPGGPQMDPLSESEYTSGGSSQGSSGSSGSSGGGWHDYDFSDTAFPIAIDLDGDGVELIPVGESDVYFDFDGDGIGERTTWTARDDGFLVFDANNSGTVDAAHEIAFSEWTRDGRTDLEALRMFDRDRDGDLDADDAAADGFEWSQFKIWQDKNSDGVSDDGELYTLEELGIVSLDLTGVEVNMVVDGGTVFHLTSFETEDGSSMEAWDIGLTTLS